MNAAVINRQSAINRNERINGSLVLGGHTGYMPSISVVDNNDDTKLMKMMMMIWTKY